MIGKFISPIVSGGSPVPIDSKGIYIFGNLGSSSYVDGVNYNFPGIGRLNSDLSIDTSFNLEYDLDSSGGKSVYIYDVAVDSTDNYITIGAIQNILTPEKTICSGIIKINSDGSYDSLFASNAGNKFYFIYSLVIDQDDKILIGGNFNIFDGISYNKIGRLNTDGTLDTSFVVGTGFNSQVECVILQTDGKILVGGNFTSFNGTSINRLIRLESDGSIDATFNIGTGFNSTVRDIVVLPDGKIYVVGSFSSFNGGTSTATNSIVRLNSDGSIDVTFNKTFSIGSTMYTVCPQSDGKVIIGGTYCPGGSTIPCGIIRFNNDGSLDNIFTKPGFYSSPSINKIIQDVDGKLIIAGEFNKYNKTTSSKIIKLNLDGTVDTAFDEYYFNTAFQTNRALTSIKRLSDGKLLITGGSMLINNSSKEFSLLKLSNYNTVVKNVVIPNYSGLSTVATAKAFIKKDNNDNFYLFGSMSKSVGIKDIIKLNSNLEVTNDQVYYEFGLIGESSSPFTPTQDMYVNFSSDEKMLISCRADIYRDTSVRSIFRINTDFTIDPTFDVTNGFSNSSSFANGVFETLDGKYFISIGYTSYNGSSNLYMPRINNDGSRDTTFTFPGFTTEGGSFIIRDCITLSDGKIMILGNFATLNSISARYIARLNSNGSLDTSFDSGLSFTDSFGNSSLFQSAIMMRETSDGKFIVAHQSYGYQGIKSPYLVKINYDGSIDSTFSSNIGDSLNYRVNDFSIASDGKIYLIGNFTRFNGNQVNGYCVLNSDGTFVPTVINFNLTPQAILIVE